MKVVIDGSVQQAKAGEFLIDLINPTDGSVPHFCHHPQLEPVQTCNT
jgi:NADH dehydrogenase/NADH:ubiquinone oxidoreductase subunit G